MMAKDTCQYCDYAAALVHEEYDETATFECRECGAKCCNFHIGGDDLCGACAHIVLNDKTNPAAGIKQLCDPPMLTNRAVGDLVCTTCGAVQTSRGVFTAPKLTKDEVIRRKMDAVSAAIVEFQQVLDMVKKHDAID